MSTMLTIINVICSWVGLFAGAGYIYACTRGACARECTQINKKIF